MAVESIRSRRWSRTRLGAGAAVVVMLALSGCGPSEEELAAEAEAQRLAAPVEIAWESEDHLLSGVERVDDTVLAYVAEGGHMYLLARDVATGEEKWKHQALAGWGDRSDAPEIAISGHGEKSYTAYYSVSDRGPGVHRVVDVETGEHFDKRSGQPIFANQPRVCGTTFCAEGERWYSMGPESWQFGDEVHTEFDWEKRRWVVRKATEGEIPMVAEDAQMAGSNLSLSFDDDEIGYGRSGELLWQRPLADIFGDEFSFDFLHAYSKDSEAGPLIYGAYRTGDERKDGSDTVTTHDLTERTSLVRLDQETGETLWEAPGMAISCDGPSGIMGPDKKIIIGCSYAAGTLTVRETPDGEEEHNEKDVDVTAVRIDADTGEELWRFELGEDPEDGEDESEGADDAALLLDDFHREAWNRDSEKILLNTRTGEEVAWEEVFEEITVCIQDRDRTEVRAYTEAANHTWSKGDDLAELARDESVFHCDRDTAETTEEMPSLAEFRRIGYEEAEDYVVLPGRTGMVAYELPQLEEVDAG